MYDYDVLRIRRDLPSSQGTTLPPVLGELRRKRQSSKCELEYLDTGWWGLNKIFFQVEHIH